MTAVEYLLYPEWQGFGVNASVHDGALAVADALFSGTRFTRIAAPRDEMLATTAGVLGLTSIASRFRAALDHLRTTAPDRVVTVGGTCGVEAAPIAYLNERWDGDLAIVWFDAHGDLNTPASSPSGHFHGMVLRTLTGDGPPEYVAELRRPIAPRQIVLAGTRDLDPDEAAFIRTAGVSVTPPEAFADPTAVARAVRERGFHRAYIHIDVDCFRPDDCPDTLMQTAGGPAFDAVAAAIDHLTNAYAIAGFSVVEYVHRGGGSMSRLKRLASALVAAVDDRRSPG